MPSADAIDALLPQTQCGQCGYAGCMPYAEAIAAGRADINQCPPGGSEGIAALAALLGLVPKPLNPANGVEKPLALAWIDEPVCIGCTKCIQACPVDAIVGASKLMHTVITDECTGCELCVAPCPVDCIHMVPAPAPRDAVDRRARADHARNRFRAREARLRREAAARAAQLAARTAVALDAGQPDPIQAALARAAARKRAASGSAPAGGT